VSGLIFDQEMGEIVDDGFESEVFFDHFLVVASALEGVFRGEVLGHFFELVVGFFEVGFVHSLYVGFDKSHIEDLFLSGPFGIVWGWI
jgi:hypothetical protein